MSTVRLLAVDGPEAGRELTVPSGARTVRVLRRAPVGILAFDADPSTATESSVTTYHPQTLMFLADQVRVCPWCYWDHTGRRRRPFGEVPDVDAPRTHPSWAHLYRVLSVQLTPGQLPDPQVVQRLTVAPPPDRRPWPCPRCPARVRAEHRMPGVQAPSHGVVFSTWLRYDDVECFRCGGWCGPEESTVWVVEEDGLVCGECATPREKAQAAIRDGFFRGGWL